MNKKWSMTSCGYRIMRRETLTRRDEWGKRWAGPSCGGVKGLFAAVGGDSEWCCSGCIGTYADEGKPR